MRPALKCTSPPADAPETIGSTRVRGTSLDSPLAAPAAFSFSAPPASLDPAFHFDGANTAPPSFQFGAGPVAFGASAPAAPVAPVASAAASDAGGLRTTNSDVEDLFDALSDRHDDQRHLDATTDRIANAASDSERVAFMMRFIDSTLPGQLVSLTGLVSKPELNGCAGHVLTKAKQDDRYPVLVDGKELAVRMANLKLMTKEAALPSAVTKAIDACEPARGSVAAGRLHALCIVGAGSVVSWGKGEYEDCSSITAETDYEEPVQRGDCRFMAHLGHGVVEGAPVILPTLVAMPVLIAQVAAGALHSLALDAQGCVWSWGWGGNGRLGHGDEVHQSSPRLISALDDKIVMVSAGTEHSLLLREDGGMMSFGRGSLGRLGLGDGDDRHLPTELSQVCLASQTPGGYMETMMASMGAPGLADRMPTSAAGIRFVHLSAGGEHNLAIREDGSLFSWGCCHDGRLGLGPPPWSPAVYPQRVKGLPTDAKCVDASASGFHSLALTSEHELWSWGTGSSERGLPQRVSCALLPGKMAAQVARVCHGSEVDADAILVLDSGAAIAFKDFKPPGSQLKAWETRSGPPAHLPLGAIADVSRGACVFGSLVRLRNGDVYQLHGQHRAETAVKVELPTSLVARHESALPPAPILVVEPEPVWPEDEEAAEEAAKRVVIQSVPAAHATMEMAQAHLDAVQGAGRQLQHCLRDGGGGGHLQVWSAGCEREVTERDEEDGEPVLETRRTSFAGFVRPGWRGSGIVAEDLGIVPPHMHSNRDPPRVLRTKRCAAPGCAAKVYQPSTDAFRARGRAGVKSDDCFYKDGLLHNLDVEGLLEGTQALDLGPEYAFRRGENAETCALTSDLVDFRCCAHGHVFGTAAVKLADYTGSGMSRI